MPTHVVGYERGYAVLRIDHETTDRGHVQVVKVFLDEATAEAEVRRLTSINAARNTTYESHLTGIVPTGSEWAPADSAAGELLTSPEPPWIVLSPGLPAATLAARIPPQVTHRILRGRKMATRQGVFNETAAAFQFPADFVENWDGFEACIKDLGSLRAPAYLMAVTDADQLLVSEANGQLATFLDVVQEAALAWSRRFTALDGRERKGVAFHCVLVCAPGRPYEATRNRLAAVGRELPMLSEASWRQ